MSYCSLIRAHKLCVCVCIYQERMASGADKSFIYWRALVSSGSVSTLLRCFNVYIQFKIDMKEIYTYVTVCTVYTCICFCREEVCSHFQPDLDVRQTQGSPDQSGRGHWPALSVHPGGHREDTPLCGVSAPQEYSSVYYINLWLNLGKSKIVSNLRFCYI